MNVRRQVSTKGQFLFPQRLPHCYELLYNLKYLTKVHFLNLEMKISNVQKIHDFDPRLHKERGGKIGYFCTLLIFISRF